MTPRTLRTAGAYIRDAIKNGLTAYNAWNMVLDKGGKGIDNTRVWAQNALLLADSGQITQTPAYYVFRHVSQFVAPGAKVVGTSWKEGSIRHAGNWLGHRQVLTSHPPRGPD